MKLNTIWAHQVDVSWADTLDPDTQITAEEAIASLIFNATYTAMNEGILSDEREQFDATYTAMNEGIFSEEQVQALSQRILLMLMTEFRPDLVDIQLKD